MRAGQSEHRVPLAPIRTPDWPSRLSGLSRILFTQPRGTPEQERHLVISFIMLYFTAFIRLWPLTRDAHSGVLIGAGGERRSIGQRTCWLMT